jgi:hypothetical protein
VRSCHCSVAERDVLLHNNEVHQSHSALHRLTRRPSSAKKLGSCKGVMNNNKKRIGVRHSCQLKYALYVQTCT